MISIKASCIDSTAPAEAVFAREVKKLQEEQLKPQEQLTLEPYERCRDCVKFYTCLDSYNSNIHSGNFECYYYCFFFIIINYIYYYVSDLDLRTQYYCILCIHTISNQILPKLSKC